MLSRNIKREKRFTYVVACIFIIVFLSIFIINFKRADNIFYRAYLSTSSNCFNINHEGYIMAGQAITSINTSFDPINTNQEIKIKIFLDKPEIIRHELCHVNQFVENRSYSCSFIFGVYKNELECYHKTSSENLTEKEQEEYLRYLA